MAVLLDGKETSARVVEELKAEVEKLRARGVTPTLALILTGTDQFSVRYVGLKAKRAEEVGIVPQTHHLEKTTNEELVALINRLNADPKVHGILVQLPLHEGLSELEAVEAIAPEKDVDGLSPITLGKILMGERCYLPAGAEAVMELLRRYSIDTEGRHWVICGMSNIVGKPLAACLSNHKARVTFLQKDDPRLAEYTRQGDIIVTELFAKHAVRAEMVKPGAVVVDFGNNYEGRKVYGDVDTEAVSKVASAITPVPGGIGPLLITMLLKNSIAAASGA